MEESQYKGTKMKVKIENLIHSFTNGDELEDYNWASLRNSLGILGYSPQTQLNTDHAHIEVCIDKKDNNKYEVLHGNHRTKVLQELYKGDLEIEVVLQKRKIINHKANDPHHTHFKGNK